MPPKLTSSAGRELVWDVLHFEVEGNTDAVRTPLWFGLDTITLAIETIL